MLVYSSNARIGKGVRGQKRHREAELREVKKSSKPGENAIEERHQGYEDHEVDHNGYRQAHSRGRTAGCCLDHIGAGLSEETGATF